MRHISLLYSSFLRGWVTAFCVWNKHGKWQGPSLTGPDTQYSRVKVDRLVLDGVHYGIVNREDVAPGFCEVDVKLNDNDEILDCMMVSGHCATSVDGEMQDGVRPLPAWFMFIKGSDKAPYGLGRFIEED